MGHLNKKTEQQFWAWASRRRKYIEQEVQAEALTQNCMDNLYLSYVNTCAIGEKLVTCRLTIICPVFHHSLNYISCSRCVCAKMDKEQMRNG